MRLKPFCSVSAFPLDITVISTLSKGERAGSRVLHCLWSYVVMKRKSGDDMGEFGDGVLCDAQINSPPPCFETAATSLAPLLSLTQTQISFARQASAGPLASKISPSPNKTTCLDVSLLASSRFVNKRAIQAPY